MPSTISAGTTAGTAIAVAGDTTGNLAFQTNGTTTAMTIDTSQNVGVGTTTMTRLLNMGGSNPGVGLSIQNSGTSGKSWSIFSTNSSASIGGGSLGFYNDTDGAYRMIIDSAGRVTMPSQPAFRATGAGGGGMITTTPVPFPTEAFDIGGNYNNSTYRFTAPVAGVYHFDAGVYINNNTSAYGLIRMDVNGSQVKYAETQSVALVVSLEISIDLYLNANDYVSLGWTTASGRQYFAGGSESHFCGHLVG